MSEYNFSVSKLFPASDKQQAVGIHATFNLSLGDADGIIVEAKDMKLMKSKEGKFYISSPYRSYEGKDQQGNPKNINISYVKFFPEEKNWNKQDAIVRMVLDELKNTSSKPNTSTSKPTYNKTTPTNKEPAKTQTKSTDAW